MAMNTTIESSNGVVVKPAILQGQILSLIDSHGSLTDPEISAELSAEGIPERALSQAITGLDRKGFITRANATAGWEVTGAGVNAMQAVLIKNTAPLISPYSRYRTITATYRLIAPSLGCETGPGGEGKALFARDVTGEILLYGAGFRAAFRKALATMEAIQMDAITRTPKRIPDASWNHVTFSTLKLPADTPTVEAIRRPINIRGQAIGEIVHEALPIGTVLTITGTFPETHFPPPILQRLWERAGEIGFSSAGSGRGGRWGVAELVGPLTIDAVQG